MKFAEQSISFGIITLALILIVFFVDFGFYRFPTVIKLFAYERELLVGLALFTLVQTMRGFLKRYTLKPVQYLRILGFGTLVTVLSVVLLHLVFRPYLTLWDDNPFLAEHPLIWNLFMPLVALILLGALFLQLICVLRLLFGRDNRSPVEMIAVMGAIILTAVGLNLVENRYAFQPVVVLGPFGRRYGWTLLVFFAIILGVDYRRWSWVKELSARNKFAAAGIIPVLLLLSWLLFSSRLLHPVYAYSITAKGLVLAGYAFVLLFGVVLWGVVLWQLPGAFVTERLQHQAAALRCLQPTLPLAQRLQELMKGCLAVTRAQLAWLETTESLSTEGSKCLFCPTPPEHIQATLRTLHSKPYCSTPENYHIIDDIRRDAQTSALALLDPRWRSMLVINLQPYLQFEAWLCLLGNRRRGFKVEHWQAIEVLLIKAAQLSAT